VLTMQQVLLKLTDYWAGLGCAVLGPAGSEVSAGTLNPATFLRMLGPEPWRAAHVEPSVRPHDSRYGDNPNRLARHTQFQVVLKPEPGDAQELYLASLRALGLDPAGHDVRFVEDCWSAPALGAWGPGWEVWLNGLEISQLTYFQQAGGYSLDPVPVEISYGVERIVMALQGVAHVNDLRHSAELCYEEVSGQAEVELSAHFLDVADVATHRSLFELYEAEARRLIEAGLPVPAHGCVLKCAHAFNVLDARKAIGPTERSRAFARMRELSHEVATLWLRHRKEHNYPLGTVQVPAAEPPEPVGYPAVEAPEPLAFEIGFEELPAAEVTRTADAVRAALTEKLAATRLRHGEIRVVGSPRRVVALVHDVAPAEDDHEQTVRGPRLTAAFEDSGAPSEATLGFARAHGVELRELRRLDLDNGYFVGFVRARRGRPAAEVLASVLAEVVTGLRAESNMRWGTPGLQFARPVRWILALLGRHVVPFSVSSLRSGRTTRPARTGATPAVEAGAAGGYLELLYEHGVIADAEARRSKILAESEEAARTVGGTIDAVAEQRLLAELANLTEHPVPLLCRFPPAYLALPPQVLTTVMRTHQRYLPVRGAGGELLPYFVAVADGECDREAVARANEAVLAARYLDASFFYEHDLQAPPEQLRKALGELTFAERLGSMADRAGRVAAIAIELATQLDLDPGERATLARAAELAKFDLASEVVTELPGLAGVMAREYARQAGEPAPVAEALYEMELPRHPADEVPASLPGALLGVADRLDLLAGLFALESSPTGSSDPFGMRRAAAGLTAILGSQPRLGPVTLDRGMAVAARYQPVELTDRARQEALRFIGRRFSQHLLDAGHPPRVVRAVLPVAWSLTEAEQTAAELTRMLSDPDFQALVAVMQRVRHIVPADAPARHYPQIFAEPAERNLYAALTRAAAELGLGAADGNPADPAAERAPAAAERVTLGQFTVVAHGLVSPVEAFFAEVRVMSEDPVVRANRIGLLAAVRDLGAGVLAWEELSR
jgi:glycyl-tRNA synthetase